MPGEDDADGEAEGAEGAGVLDPPPAAAAVAMATAAATTATPPTTARTVRRPSLPMTELVASISELSFPF